MYPATVTDSRIVIEDVDTKEDLGELAKVGAWLGYDVHIGRSDQNEKSVQIVLIRTKDNFATNEVLGMVFLQAMTAGKSPDAVIEAMRKLAKRYHMVMDKPYADTRGAGEGHGIEE